MKALVTGASGFVGRTLHDHLVDSGDEVVSLSRKTGGPDLTDRAATHAALSAHAVDVIYHLAAQSHVPLSWEDPIETHRVNIEGTQNLLDAAQAAPGSPRVLVVSSAEVYGSVTPSELPVTEDAPFRPSNPYAASKVAADAVALQSWLGRGQDVVRLRSFNHIGPGQSPAFVCSSLAHQIARAELDGLTHINVGNLDVRRDFSDVRDVVAAYRMVAESGESGQVYNVCSGVDRAISELADGLLSLSSADLELVSDPALTRQVDTPVVRGDNSRLVEATGWAPKFSLETTLADVLDDARSATR